MTDEIKKKKKKLDVLTVGFKTLKDDGDGKIIIFIQREERPSWFLCMHATINRAHFTPFDDVATCCFVDAKN